MISISKILVVPYMRNNNWIHKWTLDNFELFGIYFNKIETVMAFQWCFENIWWVCMKYIAKNELLENW